MVSFERSMKHSNKKSGRKRPRKNDIEPVVHAAPYSLAASRYLSTPN